MDFSVRGLRQQAGLNLAVATAKNTLHLEGLGEGLN